MDSAAERTVGVEEELLLVDPDGGALAIGERVIAAADISSLEQEFKLEQTEIESDPCLELTRLRGQLVSRRHAADRAARQVGGRAVALGTSPLPTRVHDTPKPRYRRMSEEFGTLADQQLTCAQHVHVAVDSRAEGVGVLDRIREWLPVLRAVTANSPFWQGIDTSYASYRSILWGQWPTALTASEFGDEAGYEATVTALLASGAALDRGMIYFDARLSEQFPTVEIRVADVCTDVDDAVLVAALCRALVDTAAREWRDGVPPMRARPELVRAATWRAVRHGLAGELVDPSGSGLADAWTVVERLRAHVAAALHRTGDEELVARQFDLLRKQGTGAERQRVVLRDRGELGAVVADAAGRTVAG